MERGLAAVPAKETSPTVYDRRTYSAVLDKGLRVMDLAALTLSRYLKPPIRVLHMNKPGPPRRVVMGETEGTFMT